MGSKGDKMEKSKDEGDLLDVGLVDGEVEEEAEATEHWDDVLDRGEASDDSRCCGCGGGGANESCTW